MTKYLGEFRVTATDEKGRVYKAQSVELLEAAVDMIAVLDTQDEQIDALVAAAAHSW